MQVPVDQIFGLLKSLSIIFFFVGHSLSVCEDLALQVPIVPKARKVARALVFVPSVDGLVEGILFTLCFQARMCDESRLAPTSSLCKVSREPKNARNKMKCREGGRGKGDETIIYRGAS